MDELFSAPDLCDFPLSLHLDMLQDNVRMTTYANAIKSEVNPSDTVIDIGTGTGILAIFAAQAGALKTVGIDYSNIIDYAKLIKELNCPELNIEFIKRNILKEDLPAISADLLICELFGNFGIDESIIDVLTTVRKQFLKPGGRIIPKAFELIVAPVQCTTAYRDLANWKRVMHGLDFSPLQERAYNCVYQITNEPIRLLSQPRSLININLLEVEALPPVLHTDFKFNTSGTVHGIAGWFKSKLTDDHLLDAGPGSADTHWGQVFFPIGEPLRVFKEGNLSFEFNELTNDNVSTWTWSGRIYPLLSAGKARHFSYKATRLFND